MLFFNASQTWPELGQKGGSNIHSIQSHADSMFLECVGVSQPYHAENEFWLVVSTYPSEKYDGVSESQLGWWNSQLNGKS